MKTISALADELRGGKTSAEDLANQSIADAREHSDRLNAFGVIMADEATEQAREVDARRKGGEDMPVLAGVPCAIKDLLCVKGVPASAASKILQGFVPPYDAEAVARLRENGAVMVGKTNMDEFGMGSSTEFSVFGVARNPVDPERVPGGSSGGSAAAVAAGIVPYALGTDTGGSIRQPAAFCGAVGFKPTYGRVSRYGLIAYASSFDQIGPITNTVEDAAIVYEAIAGHDPKDATVFSEEVGNIGASLSGDVDGLKIGLPKEFFGAGVDPAVSDAVRNAANKLAQAGARVEECSLPLSDHALAVYIILSRAEASANLARYDGVRYGQREAADTLDGMYTATRTKGFGTEVCRRILLGTFVLSAGYADRYYRKAAMLRSAIAKEYERIFESYDALILPTAPETAFRIGERTDDPLRMYMSDTLTVQANVAQLPALSVPAGKVKELPVGLQVMAPPMREDICFTVGAAVERLLH